MVLIIIGVIIGLFTWYIWSVFTYLVGIKLFPEPHTRTTLSELLRTIGFSSVPGLIRVLGIVPGTQRFIFSLAAAWMLVALVIAVKAAFNYKSTWRSVGVCLIVWIIQVIIFMLHINSIFIYYV